MENPDIFLFRFTREKPMAKRLLKITSATSIISFMAAMPLTVSAGAWTAPQGDSYLKGAINFFDTSSRFGPEDGFENFENRNFFEKMLLGMLESIDDSKSNQNKSLLSKLIHIIYGTIASEDLQSPSYFSKNFRNNFLEIMEIKYLTLDHTEKIYVLHI